MTVFIKLTRAYDGKIIAVNMAAVDMLLPHDKGTTIKFINGTAAEVINTMEEVLAATRNNIKQLT